MVTVDNKLITMGKKLDIIAGTSIGAINAAIIAAGYTEEEC